MSSAEDKAISEMPDDFVIKSFLEVHRAEVKGMLLTEYNEAEAMEMFKEEGRAEGLQFWAADHGFSGRVSVQRAYAD